MYRVRIPSKPDVELAYSLFSTPSRTDQSAKPPPRLIVFLNNLLMPASSWEETISLLNQNSYSRTDSTTPILTYDRFGQGATTSRDPLDSRPSAEPGYGHDFANVVTDLRALITVLLPKAADVSLLLIGASIGAPLARLYAATYPNTVAGLILLDSNIANANYSSFWPDPAASNFNPEEVVAPDCTLEQYIEAGEKLSKVFDLDVKNGEGLDRRNTPMLLPDADGPRLWNGDGVLTKVMVVGHDAEAFADEGLERMGTPRSFTRRWVQTAWDRYNQGLLEVGDSKAFGGVRIAKGCGHFIQRDDPGFVAKAVAEMLDVLKW